MDCYVFNPETPTDCSEEQVKALLDYAERYLSNATYPRVPGLGVSARAMVRCCKRALNGVVSERRVPEAKVQSPTAPMPRARRPYWAKATLPV